MKISFRFKEYFQRIFDLFKSRRASFECPRNTIYSLICESRIDILSDKMNVLCT